MGAAFSGGSLCRMVGGAELVVSGVIMGFGAQVLALFYSMDEEFQSEFYMIKYSAFTAITQGSLTILASLMILFASRQKPGQPPLDAIDELSENGDLENLDEKKTSIKSTSNSAKNASYLTSTAQLRKKLAIIYRLWLAFSILSIGLLLLVFFCSYDYCIQIQSDKERYITITDGGKNEVIIEDGKRRVIPPCYAESKLTMALRTALSDLYSYCLINIFAIVCFMFVVYYQLKRVTGRRKRVVKDDKVKVLSPQDDEEEVGPVVGVDVPRITVDKRGVGYGQ